MPSKYSNVSDVPLALAVFLASDTYAHNSDPNTISATTLLKPIRQIILGLRIKPGETLINLSDMMALRMGTAIHDGIERAWIKNYPAAMEALGFPKKVIDRIVINPTEKPDQLAPDAIPIYLEQRLTRKLGEWTVTGQYDFISEGKVQDFKSTGVWAFKKQSNTSKYIEQGSIYRWLDPELITANTMEIHYIFTDWKAMMTRSDPTYPARRFQTQSLELMPIGETNRFIKDKLDAIDKYLDVAEKDIPLCNDLDLWRSAPQFKYYKNGNINSSRSTKNFTTNNDAVLYMATKGGNVGAIKEVPGTVTACKYCPAFAICTQKDALIESGDLLMG
jgi:hypothetical protein